jgi:hypothetical protein
MRLLLLLLLLHARFARGAHALTGFSAEGAAANVLESARLIKEMNPCFFSGLRLPRQTPETSHAIYQVKHGRLAMVAAAGWVGAELAKNSDHLASGGRAPSVLNGHLSDWQNFLPLLAIFGAWSYLEHQVRVQSACARMNERAGAGSGVRAAVLPCSAPTTACILSLFFFFFAFSCAASFCFIR